MFLFNNTLCKNFKILIICFLLLICLTGGLFAVTNISFWALKGDYTDYTITYDTDGGNDIDSFTYNVTTDITLADTPTKEGYVFQNWKVSSAVGNWSLNDTYKNSQNIGIGWYGNVTLIAQWKASKLTITLDGNGGTINDVNDWIISSNKLTATRTYDFASNYTTLPTAMRTGYSFKGWFTDKIAGTQITAADKVSFATNTILFAHWESVKYTITYDANGGSSVLSQEYKIDTSFSLATAPTKIGYTFNGWKVVLGNGNWVTDEIYSAGENLTGKHGNITLTAQWAQGVSSYTVNHYQEKIGVDGSVHNTTNYTLKESEDLTGTTDGEVTPAVKTYEGFTKPSTQTVTIKADGSTVVNYYYTRNSYTLTFKRNYTTTDTTNVSAVTYEYGQATSKVTDPTRTGYTFGGWHDNDTCTAIHTFGTMPANNVFIYAKWEVNKYVIQFKNYDGMLLQSSEVQYGQIPQYNGSMPVKDENDGYLYEFVGWNPEIQPVTQNQVYTAVFSSSIIAHKITINNPVNGQISPNSVVSVNHGGSKTLTITANTGYFIKNIVVNGVLKYSGTTEISMEYTLNNIEQDISFTVLFDKFKFNITYEIENGDIFCDDSLENIEYGSNRLFTIVANEGYVIDVIYVNGQKINVYENQFELINLNQNQHIKVVLKKQESSAGVIIAVISIILVSITSGTITTIVLIKNKKQRKKINKKSILKNIDRTKL